MFCSKGVPACGKEFLQWKIYMCALAQAPHSMANPDVQIFAGMSSRLTHERRLLAGTAFCEAGEEFCKIITESSYITGFCTEEPGSLLKQVGDVWEAASCPFGFSAMGAASKALKGGKITGVLVNGRTILNQQDIKAIGKGLEAYEDAQDFKERLTNVLEDPIALVSGCWGPAIKAGLCITQTACYWKQSNSYIPGRGWGPAFFANAVWLQDCVDWAVLSIPFAKMGCQRGTSGLSHSPVVFLLLKIAKLLHRSHHCKYSKIGFWQEHSGKDHKLHHFIGMIAMHQLCLKASQFDLTDCSSVQPLQAPAASRAYNVWHRNR